MERRRRLLRIYRQLCVSPLAYRSSRDRYRAVQGEEREAKVKVFGMVMPKLLYETGQGNCFQRKGGSKQ